jgi:hypothetical protein
LGLALLVGIAAATTAAAMTAAGAPRDTETGVHGPREAAPDALDDAVLSARAPESDAFSAWSHVGSPDGAVRFLAADTSRGRGFSLLITRPVDPVSSGTPGLGQAVRVTGGSELHLDLRARSTGGSGGAVEVRMIAQGAAPAVLTLPAGPFDWSSFSLDLAVPPTASRVDLQIVSVASTAGTYLDGLQLSGAGSGATLINGGFEENSADLRITDSSLVLQRGSAVLHLRSRRSSTGDARWFVRSVGRPEVVLGGSMTLIDGGAALDLRTLPAGFYELVVDTDVGTRGIHRVTDFLVEDPMPSDDPAAPSRLGVGIHLGGVGIAAIRQHLSDLAALGIRYIRTDVDWASAETAPGQYTFPAVLDEMVTAAERLGMRPLLIPDYANPLYDGGATPSSGGAIAAYARFATAVAQHYPGADIDVYNEFNGPFNTGACGRTPACYMQLVAPTSTSVHAAAPGASLSGPSISGGGIDDSWIQAFVGQGGLADVDALSLHPYVQPAAPEVMEGSLDRIDAAMAADRKPIWFTEFGSSTEVGGRSPDQQAADLVRATSIGAPRGVTRLYWYDGVDDSAMRDDRESNFGLFTEPTAFAPSAMVPKASAAAEATMARAIAGTTGAQVSPGFPSDVRVIEFTGGPSPVTVAWSLGGTHDVRVTGHSVTTMTGERLDPRRATASLTGSPIWIAGGGALELVD